MKRIKKFYYTIQKYLKFIINISIMLGVIFGLRYIGYKGFIGIVIGSSITAMVFLTKNPLIMMLVKFVDGEYYLNEVLGTNDKNKKDK